MKTQVVPQGDAAEEVVRSAPVDLRSDTVTRPTPEMRRAMAEAEVGDDVYGEDPTVNRLEQRAAEIFDREAALFVPTGTMGNQVAIKVHTRPGQEVICEQHAHILDWEMAMLAHFSGCLARPVAGHDGILHWDDIQQALVTKPHFRAPTGLVALENTHNMAGGTVYPQDVADDICDRAHDAGIPVHLDGARIFNASVAAGRPVADMTRKFDSVMFCLSKGLGAPVGSMVVGSREFIEQARNYRKSLGGGMRQAGILAAAGLLALDKHVARLKDDHDLARFLAEGLAKIPGLEVSPAKTVTNIVRVGIAHTGMDAAVFSRRLAERGLLIGGIDARHVRFLTHMDVDRAAVARALEIVREVCKSSHISQGAN